MDEHDKPTAEPETPSATPIAGPLDRMANTVDSAMDLMASGRDVDGQTLVRSLSLCEQVVTFSPSPGSESIWTGG